jgi:hypothetical protein
VEFESSEGIDQIFNKMGDVGNKLSPHLSRRQLVIDNSRGNSTVVKGLLAMLEQLIEHTQKQQEDIELMKDEIRILKGEKKRPVFTPSKLDESTNDDLEEATD